MKLLSSDLSPYSTRVRILIACKGLDVDVTAPDVPLRSAEFFAKYPYGKIPVLILDDDTQLSESWSIMEFLDSQGAGERLSPDDAAELGRMRARGRYGDLHLAPALFPLFASLLHKTPVNLEEQMEKVFVELAKGEAIWSAECPESGALDLADIATAPILYFTLVTPKVLGYQGDVLAKYPRLTALWAQMQADNSVKNGLDEMDKAFKAMGQRS